MAIVSPAMPTSVRSHRREGSGMVRSESRQRRFLTQQQRLRRLLRVPRMCQDGRLPSVRACCRCRVGRPHRSGCSVIRGISPRSRRSPGSSLEVQRRGSFSCSMERRRCVTGRVAKSSSWRWNGSTGVSGCSVSAHKAGADMVSSLRQFGSQLSPVDCSCSRASTSRTQ